MAQKFADKEYYLVDSLVLEELTEGDRKILESSLKKYHSAKDDTSRIHTIEFIVEECWDDNVWPKYNGWVFNFVKQKLKTSSSKALNRSLAGALNNIGYINKSQGHVKEALDYYGRSLKIREEIGDIEGIAESLNNMGSLCHDQGQVMEALDYFTRSLKIQEYIGNKPGISNSLHNIANIYNVQNQIKEALDYHRRSLKIYEEIGDKRGTAISLNSIAAIYYYQEKPEKALDYHRRSLKISEEIGDEEGIANSHINIGAIYENEGQVLEALDYYSKGLKKWGETGDKKGIASSLNNIGSLYLAQGQVKEALDYAIKSLEISREIGFPDNIKIASELLSKVYEKQGQGMKAIEMYKLYVQMKDSINNEATQKATIRQQTKYEFEKAQIVKENEAKAEARVIAEATGRRDNIQYSLIFLGILMLFGIVLSLGFIKVSPNIAEGLIFFAFLILFEFVLVFTEPYMEQYTNGEPMYNLLANSVLAIIIFPLHAILENLLKKRIVK